jgi:hypothetical protein
MPRISMSLQLGPMVKIDIHGESCSEITNALQGFEQLNKTVDAMFSDLATRVFPAAEPGPKQNATGKDGR